MSEERIPESQEPQPPEIKVGVSACLLGHEVRFDGGHKRDLFLLKALSPYVTWVSVCPEVELGLGTPRETMRLVGDEADPSLFMPKSGRDLTQEMKDWSEQRLEELEAEQLRGYIFKSKSPSCGLFRVKVYAEDGSRAERNGRGLFAQALTRRWPLLPVEEEGRLNDPHLRENFIDRLFLYHRWSCFLEDDPSPGGLVSFHTAHKMTLLARDEVQYRAMGRMVAQAGATPFEELLQAYGEALAQAMQRPAKRGRFTNVLLHLMGFLKNHIDGDDKQELLEVIEEYRTGFVPLLVPITLLKHHFRKHPVAPWIEQQVFLNPYPKELMLRHSI